MNQVRTVVLDNEAVRALADPRHRKHRRMLAMIEAVAARILRAAGSVHLVVPTAVRVEAHWHRTAPTAAAINRLRIADVPLDAYLADRAATASRTLRVSVADAHIAASLTTTTGPHTVLTSDPDDLDRIAADCDTPVTVVPI
jgi:hypothetical protein